jgi:hypothetical protein
MKDVIHRLENFPDNVGHWERSVPLEALPGRDSIRLRKELTYTFGKSKPHLRQYQSRLGSDPGIGGVSNGCRTIRPCPQPAAFVPDSWNNQLRHDVWGNSSPLLGISQKSESKRNRMSVSKETREARLCRQSHGRLRPYDEGRHLPTRQSSGGAPVVVRGANGVHMAKGCRMNRCWTTEMFSILEGSK